MSKRMCLCLSISILIFCLFGCQNNDKQIQEKKNVSGEAISLDSNVFEMNHEPRTGFMKQKEEDIDTSKYIPIKSVSDLKKIEAGSKKAYILMNDIDMTGKSWNTIHFYGHFEGNYHVISGMKSALFSTLNGVVKNLGLENVETEDAALALCMINGTLSNCYVSGKVQGYSGLVGKVRTINSSSINIEYCYNMAQVVGIKDRIIAGGIIGEIDAANGPSTIGISNCENYGTLETKDTAGGIVGNIYRYGLPSGYYSNSKTSLHIFKCFNYGSATAERYAGGIVGELDALNPFADYSHTYSVCQCANFGDITVKRESQQKDTRAGGICAYISLENGKKISSAIQADIEDCLNAGKITRKQDIDGGICGGVSLKYGNCNMCNCLAINEGAYISDTLSGHQEGTFNVEECYATNQLSISEMKNMSKNLPKFDYPNVWGITGLYNGFPHPYPEDEREEVNKYYSEKQKQEVDKQKSSVSTEEIVQNAHYVDMLEKMNYLGCWPEDKENENPQEYLQSYSATFDAYFDIVDVDQNGEKELAVKAMNTYKVYTYDVQNSEAKNIYSSDSEEQWNSDYGDKIDIDWKTIKMENYKVFRDVYEDTYREVLQKELPEDIATYFIENEGDMEKIKEQLKSHSKMKFKESDFRDEATIKGENVINIYKDSGESLSYKKATEGITLLGVKPGVSEEELKNTIEKYGFYKSTYNYKMGDYLLYANVENGIVKELSISMGSEYVG